MDRVKKEHFLLILACCLFIFLWAGIASASERLSVKSSVANLRNGSGTKYKVLWQVEKYHPFLVINKKKDWYEVKDFEGDTAWIHKTLLGKTDTVISTKSKCNVRSKPDKSSDIVLRVERGVPFKVISRKGDWIKIEHADGEVGWIYKSLVW
nr:SH3 domain-containing protein [uncultured Desulfobacter sp.]